MGKVVVKLTNQGDLVALHRRLSKDKPRSVEVHALVDTGATRLYLKPSVIKSLGLEKVDEVISQTTNGAAKRAVYEPVRLEVQGRYGNFDSGDGAKSRIPVGGDGIAMSAVRFVSSTDNYMVFDDGGERLTVLKLNYHAEESAAIVK
jgi:hypothetical protein